MTNPLAGLPNPTEAMSQGDLAKLNEWAKERGALIETNPLMYGLPPHSGQLKVHMADEDEVFLVAANRWGKSTCGMRETLWRATHTHPYKKIRPHNVIWCGFVDFPFYNKVTYRLFKEWAPKDSLIQFHETEKWAVFQRSDGGTCTIYFLSYESGRESWQGAAVDFCWLDEELPEDVYGEANARLIDRRGQMLLTQTPVSGLGWAYDRIYIPARANLRATKIVEGALAEEDETQELRVGKPLVPHLDREQILRFARDIKDPDERDIRVFGKFKGRSGGVYKTFDPATHVIPQFKVPTYYEVWGGVDPGYHGFAAVLLAMDPLGKVFVVDEYFSQMENHTFRVRELWERVQKVYDLGDEDWVVFYCDTANPQDVLELQLWATEVGARLAFTSLKQGLKARMSGIQRIQEYLTPLKGRSKPSFVERPSPANGEPLLYFSDALESRWSEEEEGFQTSRLIWELQRYLWRRPRKGQAHATDADEASAGGAHALAALRYAMMARLGAPESPEDQIEVADPWAADHIARVERKIMGDYWE